MANKNSRSITETFGGIPKNGTAASADKTKGSEIMKQASFDSTQSSAFWYSPELTSESWLLPKSRQEILKWARIFFNLEPYIQCLVGDTKVPLLNGKTKTIKELYDEGAKDIWLYSMSPDKEVVPGKAERVELTRKDAELVRITLDNNKTLECTPDHKIMMRDGSYTEAKDLKTGDSLMPLYRKLGTQIGGKIQYKNYEMVYNPKTENYKYTHRVVSDFIYEGIKGITHHKDFNKYNNEPANLQKMSWVDHKILHKISIMLWKDPVFREKALARMKEYWEDPANRVKHSLAMEEVWKDPEYKKRMEKVFTDPIIKAKINKGNFKNKKTHAKAIETLRQLVWGTEEHAKVCSNAQIKRFKEHPEEGAKHSELMLDFWKEGKYKNNKFLQPGFQAEVNSRPTVLEKNRNAQLSYWSSMTKEQRKEEQKRRWQVRREKKEVAVVNHKVVKVEKLIERQDTYDIIFCKPYHNFALDCGIFVHNSILMMHAYYPFSKFDIITPDKSVTEFYQEMAFNETFDLYNFMLQASLSYQKFGEAICFGNLEEIKDGPWSGKKRWSKFILLEPELVEIKQAMFEESPSFELIPTEEMKKTIRATTGAGSEEERKNIPQIIRDAVNNGKNIPLDSRAVSAIQRITDPSATRGTPIMQCVFKALIYQDKIRLAQMAAADRYHFPVELWTVGDLASNILPTEDELNEIRSMINQAIQNPPFAMVFPPIIKYEALGVQGKLLPVGEDYDYIQDQIMVGLGVNKNIVTGDGPSFSNMKSMSLQKLVMVYKTIRDQFENWMINRFFRPIAIENGFYYYSGKNKKLILPQISWYKSLDIEEEESEKESYVNLHKDGYISTKTLFSKFPNLDYDTEIKQLENERSTIFDKGDRIPKAFVPSTQSNEEAGGGSPTITGPGLEEEVIKGETPGPGLEETTPAPFEEAPEATTPTPAPEATAPAATPTPPATPGV